MTVYKLLFDDQRKMIHLIGILSLKFYDHINN